MKYNLESRNIPLRIMNELKDSKKIVDSLHTLAELIERGKYAINEYSLDMGDEHNDLILIITAKNTKYEVRT